MVLAHLTSPTISPDHLDLILTTPDQVALTSLYQESEVLLPSHFTIMPS